MKGTGMTRGSLRQRLIMVAVCAPAASLVWFFSSATAHADPSPHDPPAPKPAASEPKDSDSNESESKPKSITPKTAEPKANTPKLNTPKANTPKTAEPDTAEAAEPKTAEPKAVKPKAAEPIAAAPTAEPKTAEPTEPSPGSVVPDDTNPIVDEPVTASLAKPTTEPEPPATAAVAAEPEVVEVGSPEPSTPVTVPETLTQPGTSTPISADPVDSDQILKTSDVSPADAAEPNAVLGAPGLTADEPSTFRALPGPAAKSSLIGPALNAASSPTGPAPAAVPLNSPEGQAALEQFIPPGSVQGEQHLTAYVEGYAYGFHEDPNTGVITYSNTTDHVQAVISVKNGEPQIAVVNPGQHTEIGGSQAVVYGPAYANGDAHQDAELVQNQSTTTTVIYNNSLSPSVFIPLPANAARVTPTSVSSGDELPQSLLPFLPVGSSTIPANSGQPTAFVDKYAFGFSQNPNTGVVTYVNTTDHAQALLISSGPALDERYAILQPGQYTEIPTIDAVIVLAPATASGERVIDRVYVPGPDGGTRTFDFTIDDGIPHAPNVPFTPPVIVPEPPAPATPPRRSATPRAAGNPPPAQKKKSPNSSVINRLTSDNTREYFEKLFEGNADAFYHQFLHDRENYPGAFKREQQAFGAAIDQLLHSGANSQELIDFAANQSKQYRMIERLGTFMKAVPFVTGIIGALQDIENLNEFQGPEYQEQREFWQRDFVINVISAIPTGVTQVIGTGLLLGNSLAEIWQHPEDLNVLNPFNWGR